MESEVKTVCTCGHDHEEHGHNHDRDGHGCGCGHHHAHHHDNAHDREHDECECGKHHHRDEHDCHHHRDDGCGCGHEHRRSGDAKRDKILLGLGAALLIAAWLIPTQGILRLCTFLVPYLLIGFDVIKNAVKKLAAGKMLEEDFLMTVASVGAFALGEYPEAVAVMLFYRVGEMFEEYAVGKSRRSITELMDIRPDCAVIEKDGGEERVDPNAVAVGDIIIVRPGEKIPLDGVIIEGSTTVDTAALTGESLPREVEKGQSVISGCINLTGLIRVRVTGEFGDSTVSKILALAEASSRNKSRSEAFITRFARVYTPVVVGLAVAVAVVPSLITGDWGTWINRALIFLMVSCPCALVISVPLTFFGGIGGASRQGILIKGSNYLEALSKAGTVAFDKTGTVTEGRFSVTGVCLSGSMTQGELVATAAAAECYSNHPIAMSLKAACDELPSPELIKNVEEIPGRGVRAEIDGKIVLAGNAALMRDNGVEALIDEHEGAIVHVAVGGVYAGHIVVADKIKDGAIEAVSALAQLGIDNTVMLTGDLQNVGEAVGRILGVRRVEAELLPGDKVGVIEELLKAEHGGTVVFVGDGVNDAPVLARSDVGVAMGAMGSDAAIEAADIVLMDDDIRRLPLAIRSARRTMGIVRQNIVFSLAVKFAIMIFGICGIAGMWLAIFGDVGVMMLTVLNASRALKKEKL